VCCALTACGGSDGPPKPPAPTLTSVTPAAAKWGDMLTLDGGNFGLVQGNNKVEFPSPVGANGFVVSTWSDTEITGRLAFPADGAVTIVTDGGDASTDFTTMKPWAPSASMDVAKLAQAIVLSTGDVASVYAQFELTNEPTLAVFSGPDMGAFPMASLVDMTNPTAPFVGAVFEADDHSPEVLATKPDGSVAQFTLAAGALTETATSLSGNVIAVGRDATGLYAWVETETGVERARPGTPWTVDVAPINPTYPVVAGTIGANGALWLVVSEPDMGTSAFVSVETLASGASAFGPLEKADPMSYAGDIVQATIAVGSDNVHALVTATASGTGTGAIAIAPVQRTAASTWSAAPAVPNVVQYAFFGATLGAIANEPTSTKTTSLVPDATMPSAAQVIPVWPALSSGFAVDGSGVAHPIVTMGNVEYALTPPM
jgi:hypothetical protein